MTDCQLEGLFYFGEITPEAAREIPVDTPLYLVTPIKGDGTAFGIFTYDFVGIEGEMIDLITPGGVKFSFSLQRLNLKPGSNSLSRIFLKADTARQYLDLLSEIASLNALEQNLR